MRFLILLLLVLMALGAMFATNPSSADFEAEVEAQLVQRINALDPGDQPDEASALLVATCKVGMSQCARLLRSLMDVQLEDRILYSKADIRLGQERAATCFGVLTRVVCLPER